MGCMSNRKKQTREFADQKWDHISLKDFKAKGCGAGFAYGYLWFSLLLSIVVYSVDSFTAFNLLAYNRWSSKIQPFIPIDVSKWIFSGCIILSFINLAYEGVRAYRVMRRGNVAESYLDTLAARWQSIRLGEGQGWRRFLVFAELTKSKKGSEYVALFTYFAFQSWIRVLLCSGPRQVVNAFTLKSVYESKLASDQKNVGSAFLDFFDKIRILAEEDYRQAAILSGMCFTFVVWVFSALFLLVAVCFYVFFLFHWIPRADGGLTGYCERKVNKKLLRIVDAKVTKALAKGQAQRMKAAIRNGEKPQLDRAATLPTLPDVEASQEDRLPTMPGLQRTDTKGSQSPFSSRPNSPNSIELRSMGQGRPEYERRQTDASYNSYSARAPLISSAADMGHAPPESRNPMFPDVSLNAVSPPSRSVTANSQRGYGPHPPYNQKGRPNTDAPVLGQNTGFNAVDNRQPTIPDVVGLGNGRPSQSGTVNSQVDQAPVSRPRIGPQTPPNLPHSVKGSSHPLGRPGHGGQAPLASTSTFDRPVAQNSAPKDAPAMGQLPSRTGNSFGGQRNYYEIQRGNTDEEQGKHPPPRQYMPHNPNGRSSPMPAPSLDQQMRGGPLLQQQTPINRQPPPLRSATSMAPRQGLQHPPQRNMTAPIPPPGPGRGYDERSVMPQQQIAQGARHPPPPNNYQGVGPPRHQRPSPGYDSGPLY